jgi:hypothetical protein
MIHALAMRHVHVNRLRGVVDSDLTLLFRRPTSSPAEAAIWGLLGMGMRQVFQDLARVCTRPLNVWRVSSQASISAKPFS